MILGCGVDLMQVARFDREVARRGDSLLEELFSPAEQAWCRRRRRAAEGFSVAYAAKEAVFKALGTGKVGRMAWRDVEIAWPTGAARPTMTLSGETAAVARSQGVTDWHLGLAPAKTIAVAVVMAGGAGDKALGASGTRLSPRGCQLGGRTD